MFVLSTEQFLLLLGDNSFRADSLLDLGAGDGEVTAQLADRFRKTYATEVSGPMQTLLRHKGFEILEINSWQQNRKYDMIACLNLLDRCDRPLDILDDMRQSLTPNGLVLLGLVLPFRAYVENNSHNGNRPTQRLQISGPNFETQVQSLVDQVLVPAQFQMVSWTRVPYLCEGDLENSYYWLDDVIMLLKPVPTL